MAYPCIDPNRVAGGQKVPILVGVSKLSLEIMLVVLYVEISVSVIIIDSYVEVTPSRCEYRVAPQLNNLAEIIFETIITV